VTVVLAVDANVDVPAGFQDLFKPAEFREVVARR
jgi:hypothetical protein